MDTKPPPFIPYTGGQLDRAGELRRDDAWVRHRLHARGTRLIPLWRDHNLVMSDADNPQDISPLMLTGAHARGLLQIADEVALLGLEGEQAIFCADFSSREVHELTPVVGRASFEDLRSIGALLSARDGALLAHARALLFWHRTHPFCPHCGNKTESARGGAVRQCAHPPCGAEHFPRINPAVLALVLRDGPEGGACLLGRQAVWPKGMYAPLAGFSEPGENLEETVAREVWEETSIQTENIRYRASQPWAFPAQLMVGFWADAKTTDIQINTAELEDARWFTRAQIDDFANAGLNLPRPDSLSRRLIESWRKKTSV